MKPSARAWLALGILAIAGAGLNIYREAYWPLRYTPIYRGFYVPYERLDGMDVRWPRAYAKVEFLDCGWRPLRVRVWMRAPDESQSDAMMTIGENDDRLERVVVSGAWRSVDLTVTRPGRDLALQFFPERDEEAGEGVGIGNIELSPVLSFLSVSLAMFKGALAAFGLWVVVLLPRWLQQSTAEPGLTVGAAGKSGQESEGPSFPNWKRTAAVGSLLLVYLTAWAVLKPILQSPDEFHHLLRAESILLQPWTGHPALVTLDQRFVNPLAGWPPGEVGKLPFNANAQLSRDDIDALRLVTWLHGPLPQETISTPLGTYPPGYYASAFALGESVTQLFDLTPYDSVYAYRFATVLLVVLLWSAVYVALGRTPETAPHAGAILALLLLNPMLAFISSAVTPDAVNVPLASLAVLLAYRTLITGAHLWATTIALVACMLTKPSGLLVFGGIATAITLTAVRGTATTRAFFLTGAATGRAALCGVFVFYAWMPTRTALGQRLDLTVLQYLPSLWNRAPEIVQEYWGVLGWLDYRAPLWWYAALVGVLLLNFVCAWRAGHDTRRFALFAGVFFIGYIVLFVTGEFLFLPIAGLNFQGRHLLPACIGLAGLVMHRVGWARIALIGWLGALNARLAYESLVRYFGGDWAVWWASLP